MDIKGNGGVVSVDPAEQSDVWLIKAAQEIAEVAQSRGLELPGFAGAVALESAAKTMDRLTPEMVKESITEQLTISVIATEAVVQSLNAGRRKNNQLAPRSVERVAAELKTWLTDEKLDYVKAAMETDPEVRFTLVATPNVPVTPKDITKIAKTFGQGQPYETYVWEEVYGKYTAEQLSGTDSSNGNSVVFSLIPSKYTPKMNGTVPEQRTKLAKLQADNPELGLKVPSVLESITHMQTLRAGGKRLVGNTTFDETYIRHFDLPEQRLGGWLDVPDSFVNDDGQPGLDFSGVQRGSGGRVSVG